MAFGSVHIWKSLSSFLKAEDIYFYQSLVFINLHITCRDLLSFILKAEEICHVL